jgi:hypothetical protein
MTQNIADIGIKADTSEIKEAKKDLEALVPVADKVEKKITRTSKQFDALNAAADKLSAASMGLNSTIDKLSKALDGQSAAANQANVSNAKTERQLDNLRAKYNSNYAIIKRYKDAQVEIRQAQKLGALSIDEMNDALKRQRQAALEALAASKMAANATPFLPMAKSSNLAANELLNLSRQFADIGVTAAMGMNPLMILIQQGPQIADVFATAAARGNSFKDTLRALVVQLGLVREVSKGVVATNTLLASSNTAVATSAAAAGTATTLALSPLALILAGIAAAAAVVTGGFALMAREANKNNKDIVKSLGLTADQMDVLKEKGVNTSITMGDAFKGFFMTVWDYTKGVFQPALTFMGNAWNATMDGITKTFVFVLRTLLTGISVTVKSIVLIFTNMKKVVIEIFVTMLNSVSKVIEDSVNFLVKRTNERFGSSFKTLDLPQLNNKYAGTGGNLVKDLTGLTAAEWDASGVAIDNFSKKLDANIKKVAGNRLTKAAGDPGKEKKAKTTTEKKDPIAELFKDADADIAAIRAETAQIGLYGKELAFAAAQAKLLAEAKSKGLTDTQITAIMPQINDKANQIANATTERDRKKFLEDQSVAFARNTREMQMQKEMLGMSADEALRYKAYQDLLNDALDKHIELTQADKDALKEQTDAMINSEMALKKMRENLEFSRGVVKGFFTDMREGLRNGKSIWETFLNAVINGLNKMIDRLTDQAFDKFFNAMVANKQGHGGGIGGGIIDAIGGASTRPFAKGGVVNKPTFFAYGGVQRGIMGEAGPEAIMPLKRGPNGSLGVEMHGSRQSSGSTQVTVPIYIGNEKIDEHIIEISGSVAREVTSQTLNSAGKSAARSSAYRLG